MIEPSIIEGMRKRYSSVHPLIFHRSAERARSPGELFDILETLPTEFPIVWCEEERLWKTTGDITQAEKFTISGV